MKILRQTHPGHLAHAAQEDLALVALKLLPKHVVIRDPRHLIPLLLPRRRARIHMQPRALRLAAQHAEGVDELQLLGGGDLRVAEKDDAALADQPAEGTELGGVVEDGAEGQDRLAALVARVGGDAELGADARRVVEVGEGAEVELVRGGELGGCEGLEGRDVGHGRRGGVGDCGGCHCAVEWEVVMIRGGVR